MTATVTDFDAITIDDLQSTIGAKWSYFPEGIIGAWVAEMDFGTAPVIQDALRQVVDAGYFGYLPKFANEDMKQAVADWYDRATGWQVDPEHVNAIPDVIKGFEVAMTAFSKPDSKIIVPTPAYMPFLSFPAFYNREVQQVPSQLVDGVWRLDLDGIDQAFKDGGGLLVLCNPANPVGRVLEQSELEAVAEVVSRHGGRVFADEIHAPIIYKGGRHIPYASLSDETANHTVTAISASKAWNLAGLKAAQLILTNAEDRDYWAKLGHYAGHGASTVGVIANTVAFNDGGPWLNDVLDYLDTNRQYLGQLLKDYLPTVGYSMPEGTYLTLLDFRDTVDSDQIDLFFRENAKVAMVAGSACGEAGCGFARFNFAMPKPIMKEAIERIAHAVELAPPV